MPVCRLSPQPTRPISSLLSSPSRSVSFLCFFTLDSLLSSPVTIDRAERSSWAGFPLSSLLVGTIENAGFFATSSPLRILLPRLGIAAPRRGATLVASPSPAPETEGRLGAPALPFLRRARRQELAPFLSSVAFQLISL